MKVQGIHHRPESQWKGSENKEKCWLIKGILHWKTINLKCKKNNKKNNKTGLEKEEEKKNINMVKENKVSKTTNDEEQFKRKTVEKAPKYL